jgi:hypothetical protein
MTSVGLLGALFSPSLVHGYHGLPELGRENGARFLLEATVTLVHLGLRRSPPAQFAGGRGAGLHLLCSCKCRCGRGADPALCASLFREALPAAKLTRFRGILNSTTNLILTEMEHGNSFEAAVKKAQDRAQRRLRRDRRDRPEL